MVFVPITRGRGRAQKRRRWIKHALIPNEMDSFLSKPYCPRVLFLPGVFLSDCETEESFFEDVGNYEAGLLGAPCTDVLYDSIPPFYTRYETWPKGTNLLCWMCNNSVPGMPWFIPIGLVKRPDENVEVIARRTHGNFCSPWCASRYINRVDDPKVRKWECKRMLLDLYKEITKNDLPDIPEAEDKTIMMQYCGPCGITVQEFRDQNNEKEFLFRKFIGRAD